MRMYEFNLWDKMVLKEKLVKEFKSDKDASAFINEKWKDSNLLFTWAHIPGYIREDTLRYHYEEKPPVRIELTDEEKKMKKDLRDSFTPESIEEWGKGEMSAKVSKNYYGHPNSKGYMDKK